MTNGVSLKKHLKRLNWKMTDCARLLKMSDLSVYRWIKGLSEPTTKVRRKLERMVGFKWVPKGDKHGD